MPLQLFSDSYLRPFRCPVRPERGAYRRGRIITADGSLPAGAETVIYDALNGDDFFIPLTLWYLRETVSDGNLILYLRADGSLIEGTDRPITLGQVSPLTLFPLAGVVPPRARLIISALNNVSPAAVIQLGIAISGLLSRYPDQLV